MADKFIASPVKRHYFKCTPLLGRESHLHRLHDSFFSFFLFLCFSSLFLSTALPQGQNGLYGLLRFLNSPREHFWHPDVTLARGRMPFCLTLMPFHFSAGSDKLIVLHASWIDNNSLFLKLWNSNDTIFHSEWSLILIFIYSNKLTYSP